MGRYLLFGWVLCIGCGYGKDGSPLDGDSDKPPSSDDAAVETGLADTDTASDAGLVDTDPLFDDAALHTFHVTIAAEDLAQLDKDAILEDYVPATLTFDDTPMGTVGIRYKEASSLSDCHDEAGARITTGKCVKLSYKINLVSHDGSLFGRGYAGDEMMPTKLSFQEWTPVWSAVLPSPRGVNAPLYW